MVFPKYVRNHKNGSRSEHCFCVHVRGNHARKQLQPGVFVTFGGPKVIRIMCCLLNRASEIENNCKVRVHPHIPRYPCSIRVLLTRKSTAAMGIPLGKTRRQDLLGRASVPLGRVKTKIRNVQQLLQKPHRCVFTPACLRVPSAPTCLTTPSAEWG